MDGVRLVEHLPEAPRTELARWSDLAALAPILEHRQADVGHVVAIVDRLGADVTARWRGHDVSETVKGTATDPISRSHPGGWSQKHFQLKVQENWDRNAHQVAKEVTRLADEADAEYLVVAGDVRAAQLLRDALPDRLRPLVREAAGTRSADGGDAHSEHDLHRLLRTAVAADTVELLRTFQQEQGQHDRAANGPAATLDALRRSQVDVLLVHDDPGDERTWWYGEDPLVVAASESEVRSLGAEEARRGRLADVAIRAALGSGATVRVVPAAGPLQGGIGAILRWGQGTSEDQGGT
jgi:peptide subunit release factor 1 (eRF1)